MQVYQAFTTKMSPSQDDMTDDYDYDSTDSADSDYSDPHVNYHRLKETQAYLSVVVAASGADGAPPRSWFREHIKHIKVYLDVLQKTGDRDQTSVTIMLNLLVEFAHYGYFNLENYLAICGSLLEIIGDIHLEEAMEKMGM